MPWSWRTLKQIPSMDNWTADKFWSAVSVWNTKPHLLIKHLMGAEKLFSYTLVGDMSEVFNLLTDQPITWIENPTEMFQILGLNNGGDFEVEVWKLLTKRPVSWNDYLRMTIIGKHSYLNKSVFKC